MPQIDVSGMGDNLMSNGKEFRKLMCREGDCLISGDKEFHKLVR